MSQIQSYVKDVSIQIIWHAYSNTIGITFFGGRGGGPTCFTAKPHFRHKIWPYKLQGGSYNLIMRCDLFVNDCLLNSFVQAQIKENIKVPRHWLLWGESTGARWIPLTNRHHAKAWIRLCAITNWPRCLYENTQLWQECYSTEWASYGYIWCVGTTLFFCHI